VRGNASDKGWRFTVTPYAWIPWITGDVGVGRITSNIDITPHDVLKTLDFAAMATAEARRQWFVGGIDAIYVALSGDRAVAFLGDTGNFSLKIQEAIITPFAGYSVGNATWTLDVLAAARYWSVKPRLTVDRPNGRSVDVSQRVDWWDAVGGLRLTGTIVPHLRFTAGGDVGGGGAKSDWQVHGDVGYDVSTRWTVGLAYRVLGVDYSKKLVDNLHTEGFLVAGTYRF
jgi:hypothetical protein